MDDASITAIVGAITGKSGFWAGLYISLAFCAVRRENTKNVAGAETARSVRDDHCSRGSSAHSSKKTPELECAVNRQGRRGLYIGSKKKFPTNF